MPVKTSLALCLSLCLFACGGGQKPAEEPAPEAPADSAKSGGKDAAEKPAEKSEPKADSSKDEKSDSSDGPKIKRMARDILTAPDVIFMFAFNESDLKQQAEKQCDEEAKDPKKRADCMTKAKSKIEADGMAFKQEKGKWYWLTVRRKGKTLVDVHKLPVEFDKEEEHSVVLKPVGKDEGKSPKTAPGETKVEVPNEYQIVIKDPKFGKMVYEAKIGLTGGSDRP